MTDTPTAQLAPDDLRLAAAGVDEGLAGSGWLDLVYRLEAAADVLASGAEVIGYRFADGTLTAMEPAEHESRLLNVGDEGYSHWMEPISWRFPATTETEQ